MPLLLDRRLLRPLAARAILARGGIPNAASPVLCASTSSGLGFFDPLQQLPGPRRRLRVARHTFGAPLLEEPVARGRADGRDQYAPVTWHAVAAGRVLCGRWTGRQRIGRRGRDGAADQLEHKLIQRDLPLVVGAGEADQLAIEVHGVVAGLAIVDDLFAVHRWLLSCCYLPFGSVDSACWSVRYVEPSDVKKSR